MCWDFPSEEEKEFGGTLLREGSRKKGENSRSTLMRGEKVA